MNCRKGPKKKSNPEKIIIKTVAIIKNIQYICNSFEQNNSKTQ
jgi:hypothetical protein